jgi:hypothetical protein
MAKDLEERLEAALKSADKDKAKQGKAARALHGWLTSDPGRASDHVLSAIAQGRGHLPTVAKNLGIGERTLDRILKDHPAFAKVAGDMREAAKSVEVARREAGGER